MTKNLTPVDAVIAVTYKCNSRCTMCDIWKIKEHDDFDKNNLQKLPQTLKFVNISGGEPFLRDDFADIIKIVLERCPKSQIVISSNGFAPDLIEKRIKEVLAFAKGRVGVGLSLDGIGEMHDTIRGIKGGYERVLDTLQRLQKLGMKNIRFGFTINNQNISHINKVYELAKENGVQFTLTAAQSSEIFFGGKENVLNITGQEFKKEMDVLIKKYLKGFDVKNWLRAYFAKGVYDFAIGKEMLLPPVSGSLHFFMDPHGDIYPSVVHNFPMGNIKTQSFDDIWHSVKADEVREKVKNSNQRVWMVCTARSAIMKNPLKVAWWIVKNKFFN